MSRISIFLLLSFHALYGYAQNILVSGTVSADGETLPGVNIVVKGTSNGSITDIDGKYTLEVPDQSATLVFSFVGYEAQEVVVGNRTLIDITLQSDAKQLEEIVVVGYGVQKKSIATASVSKVESKDIQGFSVARADQALQGQVAGVTFKSTSGQPGSGQNIFIRGVGTNGDAAPLTIVDGVMFTDNGILATINPSDIESIQVLKDGASTAIYGTRAANGIIIVTTKKGQAGKTIFNYDFNYGVSNAWRVPEMLNADQYIELINEKYGSSNLPGNFPDQATNNFDTNWMDEIFESGSSQTHQLSVSRGTESGSFYASLSYFDQKGIIAPDKSNLQRLTARINSESKINDFLTFKQNLFLTHLENNKIAENSEFGTPIGDAIVYDPTTPTLDANLLYGFAQSPFVQKEYISPLSRIFINNIKEGQHGVAGNLALEVKPIKGLKVVTDVGYKYDVYTGSYFIPSFEFNDIFGNLLPVSNEVNDILETYTNVWSWQWENYATYNKSYGKHNGEITVGVSAQERLGEDRYRPGFTFGGSSSGINEDVQLDPNFRFITQTPDSLKRAFSGQAERQALSSVFGRLSYNYGEKYLATLILRRDGSTQFGKNNRYGLFPSASLGWVITEEDFWPLDFINFMKVRASYGINGNDRIRSLSFVSTVQFSGDYQFGKPGGQTIFLGQSQLSVDNPDVKWEQSKHLDIGIEGGLFGDKLTFELDYFRKTTSDLLMDDTSIPIKAGLNPSVANVGEVVNSGIELELSYKTSLGEVDLNFGFNASTLKNEVTQVTSDGGFISGYNWPIRNAEITRMEAGRPLAYFFGYKTGGVFKSQNDVFSHINSSGDLLQPNAVPGDLKFVDVNADGVIDADDRTEIGKPWADLMMGLNIGANYKNFDLRILLNSSFGSEVFRSYERQDVVNNNYQVEWLDRWSETNPNGSYPRVTLADANNNSRPSDFYVESGDFLRIRTLQIGYSLPPALLKKIKASRLRVYVSADNLATLTGYTGFDPEIGTRDGWILDTAIDKGFYPQTRTFALGVNLSL